MQWGTALRGLIAKLYAADKTNYNHFKHTPKRSEDTTRTHMKHCFLCTHNVHKQVDFTDNTLRWVFVKEDGILQSFNSSIVVKDPANENFLVALVRLGDNIAGDVLVLILLEMFNGTVMSLMKGDFANKAGIT